MILTSLLGLLVGSFVLLKVVARIRGLAALDTRLCGRISLAILFLFTGLGHFVMTDQMAQMLPAWVPMRVPLIYATGALEWAGAIGLLVPSTSRAAGLCLILFLVMVFPANVYAAANEVAMGGHEAGLKYLLVRGPFQALLIWWAWWFAVR
ncbi:MAG: DoxX family protein [Candidatus Polarisedimenticolia bacterium]